MDGRRAWTLDTGGAQPGSARALGRSDKRPLDLEQGSLVDASS